MMSNARCWRRRRVALAIATSLLSGCVFLLVLAKIGQGLALREVGSCHDLFLHLLGLLRFPVAALLVTFGHFDSPDCMSFLTN
jgi:hypothetical protein